MAVAMPAQRPVGQLLRAWRERRRLSQLALSLDAEISTRHLSYVETGRAAPSREMVLRLAEQLEVPLRERNALLLAAGYAPVYPESDLDDVAMSAVRTAIRQLLTAHEPYPALVIDRAWNLIEANGSVALFTASLPGELLAPPINVLRASLHPEGLAARIVNLGEWRGHVFGRLRRQIALTGDPSLVALLDELRAYPCDQPEPEIELPGPGEVLVPLRVRLPATSMAAGSPDTARAALDAPAAVVAPSELAFFTTVATFGTPLDVTLSELAIEAFYPADPETTAYLRSASLPSSPVILSATQGDGGA
jgi:transcriptional regulator with XRE-family HTH domain